MEVLRDRDVATDSVTHPLVERYVPQVSAHITRQVRCLHSVLRRCMDGDVDHALRVYKSPGCMNTPDEGWWFMSLVREPFRGTVPVNFFFFFYFILFLFTNFFLFNSFTAFF